MVNKHETHFRETAKKVAAHISAQNDELPRVKRIKYSDDGVWIEKNVLATEIFFRFVRYLVDSQDAKLKKNLDKFPPLQTAIAPETGKCPPWLPKDLGTPVYEADFLIEIINTFLGSYIPPNNNFNTTSNNRVMHLWAMQLYYSEIAFHVRNVSLEAIGKIDYAFTRLSISITAFLVSHAVKIEKDLGRISRSNAAMKSKTKAWHEKALSIINQSKLPPSPNFKQPHVAARLMRESWRKLYPDDDWTPKEVTLSRFLKEYLKDRDCQR